MEKAEVIRVRDILKCGKNYPLRLHIDNVYRVIDESLTTQFTIWDDENATLYLYSLIGPQEDKIPNNSYKAVSLLAIDYDIIQGMEVCALPIADLDTSFEYLERDGHTLSSEFKERIKRTYTQLFHDGRYVLTNAELNNISGSMEPTGDSYYGNKFRENFKETLQERGHNLNAAKENEFEPYKDGINEMYTRSESDSEEP